MRPAHGLKRLDDAVERGLRPVVILRRRVVRLDSIQGAAEQVECVVQAPVG
jgi:hypothetical protein